jgi:hypothetical protein
MSNDVLAAGSKTESGIGIRRWCDEKAAKVAMTQASLLNHSHMKAVDPVATRSFQDAASKTATGARTREKAL